MDGLTFSLLAATVVVAVLHTAIGPDHYLPFVLLSRARGWSLGRTLSITALCGLGHVLSSLLVGGVGIAAGLALGAVQSVESQRGAIAAWALLGVGVAYGLWGVRQAMRQQRGVLLHAHGAVLHLHGGGHRHHLHARAAAQHEHAHAHAAVPRLAVGRETTFWALFVVFVLGPCEPLIPLFLVPASEQRWGAAVVTGLVFAVATIATMLGITALAVCGMARMSLAPLQRWMHALAGGVMAAAAAGMLCFDL